jgi:hypothetical protein
LPVSGIAKKAAGRCPVDVKGEVLRTSG